jgi:hypothetical protein
VCVPMLGVSVGFETVSSLEQSGPLLPRARPAIYP